MGIFMLLLSVFVIASFNNSNLASSLILSLYEFIKQLKIHSSQPNDSSSSLDQSKLIFYENLQKMMNIFTNFSSSVDDLVNTDWNNIYELIVEKSPKFQQNSFFSFSKVVGLFFLIVFMVISAVLCKSYIDTLKENLQVQQNLVDRHESTIASLNEQFNKQLDSENVLMQKIISNYNEKIISLTKIIRQINQSREEELKNSSQAQSPNQNDMYLTVHSLKSANKKLLEEKKQLEKKLSSFQQLDDKNDEKNEAKNNNGLNRMIREAKYQSFSRCFSFNDH
uniref:Uncharacterized protein n=1 Tax=Coptotermes formosanus TaxID=36987 RepID=R4V345_COPFO|nr:hypothetical protein [Coptotermes formosanus]